MKKKNLADALRNEKITISPAILEPSDEGKKKFNINLDVEAHQQLRMLAAKEKTTMHALVCDGINRIFLERNLPPIAK